MIIRKLILINKFINEKEYSFYHCHLLKKKFILQNQFKLNLQKKQKVLTNGKNKTIKIKVFKTKLNP